MSLVLLVLGCLSEGAYVERVAAADCGWLAECHPDQFDARYADDAECEARHAQILEAAAEVLDCPYHPGRAARCLRQRKGRACDADADCDDVWSCE